MQGTLVYKYTIMEGYTFAQFQENQQLIYFYNAWSTMSSSSSERGCKASSTMSSSSMDEAVRVRN